MAGPLSKSSPNDDLINALLSQYQANQPTGPLSQLDPLWLGAAQGFLAPTKTGSFGESLGAAMAGVASPLQTMRKAQMDALEKIATIQNTRDRLNMMDPYWEAKTQYLLNRGAGGAGGSSTIEATHLSNILKGLQYQYQTERDPNKKAQIASDIGVVQQKLRQAIGSQEIPQTQEQTPAKVPDTRNPLQKVLPSWLGGEPDPNAPAATTPAPAPAAPAAAAPAAAAPATTAPQLKAPPASVKNSALKAIANGADPVAVMKRLQDNGFSTEGIQ